jgi:hypothetical protein
VADAGADHPPQPDGPRAPRWRALTTAVIPHVHRR